MKRIAFFAAASIVLASPACADTFFDSFNSGIRSAFWTVQQTTDGQFAVDDSAGHVHFDRINPSSPGGVQNIGLYLNMNRFGGPIDGDFSAQVDFSNANIVQPGLNQVELHANFANGTIFFVVFDNNYGQGLNYHVWNGNLSSEMAASTTSGTLRIVRSGSLISGYSGDALIFSQNNGSPLTSMSFVLQNNVGGASPISVDFDNFSMTTDVNCPADFNNDGFLDFFDFNDFVTCFEGGDCPDGKTADFNGDGFADFFDFNDFVSAFEAGC